MSRSSSRFWLASLAVAISLAAVLTLPATSVAQKKRTKPRAATAQKSDYPKIRAAIASLEAAKAELVNSNKDFGGHKQDAIDAINDALKRMRLALQFEKY